MPGRLSSEEFVDLDVVLGRAELDTIIREYFILAYPDVPLRSHAERNRQPSVQLRLPLRLAPVGSCSFTFNHPGARLGAMSGGSLQVALMSYAFDLFEPADLLAA